jgi:hypothetical protein
MNRRRHVLLLIAPITLLNLQCSKGGDSITAITGSVTGTDGAPLADVSIAAAGATATSDAKGAFRLDAPAGASTSVTFARSGYVATRKLVDVQDGRATALAVAMMAEAAAKPLDADAGGTVTGSRGAQLAAAAGSFVDKNGAAVTGTVQVHLTAFDPSREGERKAMPNLSAETLTGDAVELESFGALDVTVRQQGEKLQVKSGTRVTIRIPAPSGASAPPATMPLWSFDEASGRWKEEGTVTYLAGEKVYEGQIGHMSMWNADQPLTATCLSGIVKEDGGAPLAGARVTGFGIDYNGSSEATAGSDGRFCLAVRKSSKVRVMAIHPSGGGTAREVQSGAGETSVPPSCGDPRCVDAGEWVVKAGTVVGPGGTNTACANVPNPFAGSCAEQMWGFAGCFAPSGSCTFNVSTTTTTWANGSRMVVGAAGVGGTMTYVGPAGNTCATATFQETPDGSYQIAYLMPGSDQPVTIKMDASGSSAIVCPDGQTFPLNSEAQQAYQACAGGAPQQGAPTGCTIEGIPGQCKPSDPASCPVGQLCCTVAGFSICMEGETCP